MELTTPALAAPKSQRRRTRPSGSSFYAGMRILPRRSATRCSRSTASAARSTTSPTTARHAPGATRQLDALARRHRHALCRRHRRRRWRSGRGGARLRSAQEDFLAVIDGMEMDVAADIRAPDLAHARSLLRPRRQRRRPAVGHGLRHGGRSRASSWPIISAARCSSPTSCATSTRMPRSAGSICRAKRLRGRGIDARDPAAVLARSAHLTPPARSSPPRAHAHFAEADAVMARRRRGRASAAADGRGLSADPDAHGAAGLERRRASASALGKLRS